MANTAAGSKAARHYRPRRIEFGDGELLVLRADGMIEHRDPEGVVVGSWLPADPAWPQWAIRFGIRPAPETVKPTGRNTPASKPLA
jgi:hypothetical protein